MRIMAKDRIPTSRLRAHGARVGRSRPARPRASSARARRTSTRDEEGKQAALERRQLETAEQIVAALGTMKGAAMKLGQVMAFLDVGLVPEEYREEFQPKLAELRDAAPKVSLQGHAQGDRAEYGEPIEDVFETFDPAPIAAASIGQVYRARLHDGRDVAVKVQYPGVAQAVRADMQNLGMILRLMKRVAPGPGRRRRWPRRSARASTRSSTTSSRPRTSARSRASTAATRSSSCPTSSRRCRASR